MSKANGASAVTDLASATAEIESAFGAEAVRSLGEAPLAGVEVIPTGALSLDLALGVGGFPRGRIVEVYGPESSGKTTLTYHAIAEAQRLGGRCAYIDAEHAMDPIYAAAIGVDTDDAAALPARPRRAGAGDRRPAGPLGRGGAGRDRLGRGAVAEGRARGPMGDQTVGLQARMMGQAMRKLAGHVRRGGRDVLFTNQLREKVGVVYGPRETQPGGRALKFYASQRLDIRRIETLKEGEEAVGNRARVKVVKNKVAPPFRLAEFDIDFGRGISQGRLRARRRGGGGGRQRSGAYFAFGEERLGQGRAKAKAVLEERPELVEEIEGRVREEAARCS